MNFDGQYDLVIVLQCASMVVEIKPYKQTQEPKKKKSTRNMLMESLTFSINKAKWAAAKTFCEKYDWEFIILTEKELFK